MITHLQTYQTLQDITVSQHIEELPIKAMNYNQYTLYVYIHIYAYSLWMTNLVISTWGITDLKIEFFFLETIRFVLNVAVILAAVCTVDVQLLYEWWLMLERSKHLTSRGTGHTDQHWFFTCSSNVDMLWKVHGELWAIFVFRNGWVSVLEHIKLRHV